MRRKQGSLSLSVNAIVILILAITMLGLGLGFIKGTFGSVTKQVEEQIAAEPDPPTPSASDPITLSRTAIVTSPKKEEVIKVSAYNPGQGVWTTTGAGGGGGGPPAPICAGSSITDVGNIFAQGTSCTSQGDCEMESGSCNPKIPAQTITCPSNIGFADPTSYCSKVNCDESGGVCIPQTAGGGGGATTKLEWDCPGLFPPVGDPDYNPVAIIFTKKDIESGDAGTFTAILSIPKGTPAKTYLCQFGFAPYTQDFSVKVRS
jgi:hypothetical protein